MRYNRNKAGFSLVAALVGIVIVGILAAAAYSLINTMSSGVKRVEDKAGFQRKINEVNMALASSGNCKCNFKNLLFPNNNTLDSLVMDINDIRLFDLSTSTCAAIANDLIVGSVSATPPGQKVASIKLYNFRKLSNFILFADLIVSPLREVGKMANKDVSIPISFATTVDGSNLKVDSCALQSVATSTNPKIYRGTVNVYWLNGKTASSQTSIAFSSTCVNPSVFVRTYYDSIATGSPSGPNGSSTDLFAFASSVNSAGFKAYLSTAIGVWVGASSPAYPIHWMALCDP